MLPTEHFIRFEHVTSAEQTERGLLAAVHGERLRIDVVRDDVVRIKISRGGVFDEAPTLRGVRRPARRAGRLHGRARRRARARADRRRWWSRCGSTRSGSTSTARTAAPSSRRRRRRRALLGLRHAQRRLHDPPPLPAGGRDLRARREERAAQPQGPRLHAVEHRRARRRARPRSSPPARDAGDPRADRTSTEFDPYYVSIPFFHHHALPGRARSARPSSTTATAAHYDFTRADEYAHPLRRAASTPSTSSPGRDMPRHPRGLHLADRADGAAAAVGARLPPVPLVPLHAGRGRGARRRATASDDVPCDALWLDIDYMDGYRVFTWDTRGVPRPAGDARAARASRASGSSRSSTPA